MNHYFVFALLLFLGSCKSEGKMQYSAEFNDVAGETSSYSFFVGTYTHAESEGIYKYELKGNGEIEFTSLASSSDNPSFLALSKDKQSLLAVNEIEKGSVESYSIKGDSLSLVNRQSSEGAHPCFITVNENGYVLTANYSSGNVSLLHLDQDGSLSSALDVQQHSGQGTSPRQEGPHAHSSWFVPGGEEVISVDLGTNELLFFSLNKDSQELTPTAPYRLAMEPGAGPRHLAFHPDAHFLYVVNELTSTVSVIEKTTPTTYALRESYSMLPEDFSGESFAADIHISSDGKFLYASNRGHNSIAVFEVQHQGRELRLINTVPTEGDWPRNFALSPDEKFLLVANQHSNNLVSFSRNAASGQLELVTTAHSTTPVHIVFE